MLTSRNPKQFSVRVYDSKHLRNLSARLRKVQALIDNAANQAVTIAVRTGYTDTSKDFQFNDFPQARRDIDALLVELSKSLTLNVQEANSEAWGTANDKNDAMVDFTLASAGSKLDKRTTRRWYNKNTRALNAFNQRVAGGMDLSTNVWRLNDFKSELELALEMGLGRGKAAAELSRDVRSYLKYPNKLFRRVRDEKGNLRLSRAAAAFHPGQGVYRSSYKNALRLTATETNMAYRTADSKRWAQIDFVLGQTIQLSKSHPIYDICDELAGDYPKDFVFTGWHPFCKCFAVAKLPTTEQFIKYQQAILNGEDVSNWDWGGKVVEDVPSVFKNWLERNRERVKTTTTIPYFIKDNGKYIPKDWVDGIGSMSKDRDKGIITDVKEAMIKLKDPTFITEKEVRNMIERYADAEPGDFYGGLKAVKVSKTSGETMMCCERAYYNNSGAYAVDNGNIIKIYKTDQHVIDPQGNSVVFNPLHELKGAMRAIAEKSALTFNQEYAIESLWHEIRHAGAVGWGDIRKRTDDLSSAMECINQFCARRSYGKLLRAIGGSVSHKQEIIKSGYGYGRSLRHFEEMLVSMNIPSSEAYAHFNKMIMVEPYENIFGNIVDFLISKGVDKKKAEMLIKTLRLPDVLFGKVLTGA